MTEGRQQAAKSRLFEATPELPETGHNRRMTLLRRSLPAITIAMTAVAAALYWINPEKVVLPVTLVGIFLLLATLTRADRDLFAIWRAAPPIFRVASVCLVVIGIVQIRNFTDDIWGLPVAMAFAVFILGLACAIARRTGQ